MCPFAATREIVPRQKRCPRTTNGTTIVGNRTHKLSTLARRAPPDQGDGPLAGVSALVQDAFIRITVRMHRGGRPFAHA
ncbi:hypothetical protein PSCLAVI8L_30030 [Pseudoclavibacter sp. 8L]|nr:hypothetical protein PSCLAVI8L_30030 [Pseudoclavibacter sp. 8L]